MTTATVPAQTQVEWAKGWFDDNSDRLVASIAEACPLLESSYVEAAVAHLWVRLVDRLIKDHGLDYATAEQHQSAGLAFLHSGRPSPTAFEDVGWHNLLHYTAEYPAVCQVLVGHYVHHLPNDVPGFGQGASCDNGVSCENNCRGNPG